MLLHRVPLLRGDSLALLPVPRLDVPPPVHPSQWLVATGPSRSVLVPALPAGCHIRQGRNGAPTGLATRLASTREATHRTAPGAASLAVERATSCAWAPCAACGIAARWQLRAQTADVPARSACATTVVALRQPVIPVAYKGWPSEVRPWQARGRLAASCQCTACGRTARGALA